MSFEEFKLCNNESCIRDSPMETVAAQICRLSSFVGDIVCVCVCDCSSQIDVDCDKIVCDKLTKVSVETVGPKTPWQHALPAPLNAHSGFLPLVTDCDICQSFG